MGPGSGLEALAKKMSHMLHLLRFKCGFVTSFAVTPTGLSRFRLELQVMNCTSRIMNKPKDNPYIQIPTNYEIQITINTQKTLIFRVQTHNKWLSATV